MSIIKYGAVQHLVKMLLAQHALMQNEAIMGLTILTKICSAESEELLIKADFGRNMCEFFARANDLDVPIILNALSLLESSILQSGISKIYRPRNEKRLSLNSRLTAETFTVLDRLKEHFKSCGLTNAVCKILLINKNTTPELQNQITNLQAMLDTALGTN